MKKRPSEDGLFCFQTFIFGIPFYAFFTRIHVVPWAGRPSVLQGGNVSPLERAIVDEE